MKIRVYPTANDVPVEYFRHLKEMGIVGGMLRPVFFNSPEQVTDITIVTVRNIPVAWAMMTVEGVLYTGWKSIMLYTKPEYRGKGYAAACYKKLSELHPKFFVHQTRTNTGFFQKMGHDPYTGWMA